MTKAELIAILANYADDQLVLVESAQGFEEPKIYVTAVRPRRSDEHDDASASDKRCFLPLLPRYTLPDFAQSWRGRFMQILVDYLHRSGD